MIVHINVDKETVRQILSDDLGMKKSFDKKIGPTNVGTRRSLSSSL
jgi:hypothetical protein